MKIGVITDIHSNIQALKCILKELDKIGVDKIICCGDIIGVGINPEETVQELIKRKDKIIAVRGNHEQYLLKGLPKKVHDNKRKMEKEEIENHKWNHSKLSKESIKYLNNLKISENLEIEGIKIHIVHYPQKNDGTYKKIIKNPTILENREMFEENNADIFLYGHTHITCINNIDNKWYINPGTLGCPKNSNMAKAGLLEIKNGKITFDMINVKYNIKEIIKEIKNIKMPFYNEIIQIFYEISSNKN